MLKWGYFWTSPYFPNKIGQSHSWICPIISYYLLGTSCRFTCYGYFFPMTMMVSLSSKGFPSTSPVSVSMTSPVASPKYPINTCLSNFTIKYRNCRRRPNPIHKKRCSHPDHTNRWHQRLWENPPLRSKDHLRRLRVIRSVKYQQRLPM